MPSLLLAAIAIFAAAVIAVPLLVSWNTLRPIERAGRRLARRPAAACVAVFLFALATSAGVTLTTHIPLPVVHDEFSYLVAADTFAHGRLTNPPHPLYKSFETFHVLDHPTYQSKYPPGQGLTLALGKVLTGLPIAGVWLTTATAAAAICWMLMAWVPRRWALLGGLLATLHPMVLKWSQTYWGGTLALTGGALLFGGLRRCLGPPGGRVRGALAMGVGTGILGLSRPYEGAAMVAFALAVYGVERGRQRPEAAGIARMAAAYLAPVAAAVVFLGIYNTSVTGSPTRLPYTVYEHRYCPVPMFLFGKVRPFPPYDNPQMKAMITDYDLPLFLDETSSPANVVVYCLRKTLVMQMFCFQTFDLFTFALDPFAPIRCALADGLKYVQLVALLALPFALGAGLESGSGSAKALAGRDRWNRYALVGLAIGAVVILTEPYLNTHYAAPPAPLLAVVFIGCLRGLWVSGAGRRRVGRALVRTLMLLYVAGFAVSYQQYRHAPQIRFTVDRAATEARLARLPGRHLVFVRYLPKHDWGAECVYNAADIDHAPVVWARELDPEQNRKVLAYYRDRTAWLYEPDLKPALLAPYPAGGVGGR